MKLSERLYRLLLRFYPAAFREEYGGQMLLAFREDQANGRTGTAVAHAAFDAFTIAPKEHLHVLLQDLRYAFRAMAARPGFTAVAILSLALGIGANTAIYSLWDNVLHAPLPMVKNPHELVILTDPSAEGAQNGDSNGDRTWLTYTEFLDLRQHADSFSDLMASEASLGIWRAQSPDGGEEELRGRLVSGNYFDFLGVRPAMGRVFNDSDDAAEAPYVVVSYNYWQARWGGRADILGQTIRMPGAALTIIGVMPRGFIGETTGQNPDAWVSLRLQPKILRGEDRLHDAPPSKMMWLHAFGRLKPGVLLAQAGAQTNILFKNGLEAYYAGIRSPEQRREFLDQRLALQSAPGGASGVRGDFATFLTAMLGGVAILLLIACANLANLLLARGAARRSEVAMRLSLGATRARLMRQLLTESLTLSALGGAAAVAVAFVLHRALVSMMKEIEDSFRMEFTLNIPVLLFLLSVTVAASLLFGVLPAWHATRADAGEALKEQNRSSTGSAGRSRSGRLLAAAQLALCVPLLMCAGLMVRTLQNLQQVELGYSTNGLIEMRVSTVAAGYDSQRRDQFLTALLADIRRIPGVRNATFAHNGLFTGSRSGSPVEVEGYTPTGEGDRDSSWDVVQADYFSTMGLRIVSGRAMQDGDHASAPRVMIVNEAFAKQFFDGRSPLGKRVVVNRDQVLYPHTVIGVVQNFRTQGAQIRTPVAPRFFTAAEQSYIGDRLRSNLLVRTSRDPGPVLAAMRQAVQRTDPSVPIYSSVAVDLLVGEVFKSARTSAQLALIFGAVALALAAIGLYGVLSYGVAQRSREIAIRIALGARPSGVIVMILRETSWVVLGGLLLGGGLAYAASRWIASELFGVEPHDPASLVLALTVLVTISFAAAYLPSRRASRLEPMAALRKE